MQLIYYGGTLYHHGIKGQHWGTRRYQNSDGSLTPAGRERYGRKGIRISNSADRYIHNINKSYNKTMAKRNEVREKIAKKYDKKIAKYSKKPEKHSDAIKELTKEKNDNLRRHKGFDKYVNAGYQQCVNTVSNYRNVKLKTLNDKGYKQTAQYKNAVAFYKKMQRQQSLNYGHIEAVALRNTIEAYKRSNSK